ncbi:LuxR C-terminal-related transcriptional regulator, partial [Solirubrobacter ginsenosidimutans]
DDAPARRAAALNGAARGGEAAVAPARDAAAGGRRPSAPDARAAASLALTSVAATDALGLAVESARGRIVAGRALAAAGDRDGAAEQLRAAEGLLVDAPSSHLRAEAVRELRRIGRRVNRAGRAGRADAAGPAALTVRELEIARLVAGGLTNRAVAETLFLSEKTIETHLSGAFVKLGVRSRQALGAALDAG